MMATNREPDKDIAFLLAVVHNLTITTEFVNKAIENWRKLVRYSLSRQKTDDLKLPTCVLLFLLMARILVAASRRFGRR